MKFPELIIHIDEKWKLEVAVAEDTDEEVSIYIRTINEWDPEDSEHIDVPKDIFLAMCRMYAAIADKS